MAACSSEITGITPLPHMGPSPRVEMLSAEMRPRSASQLMMATSVEIPIEFDPLPDGESLPNLDTDPLIPSDPDEDPEGTAVTNPRTRRPSIPDSTSAKKKKRG